MNTSSQSARHAEPQPPRLDRAGLAGLLRPRIALLVLVVTAAGFALERPADISPLPWALAGTLLVSAAGCALNHYLERDTDARMERTAVRPLVTGALSDRQVLLGAGAALAVGLIVLWWGAGAPAALIQQGAIVVYLGIYTPLKRRTSANTWVGAIPGALPVLCGAAAAGGPTRIAWITFALIFLWQLPHFFAIASMYREEYASGGLRMLSGVDPEDALLRWQMPMQVMSVMLVSLLPVLVGTAGGAYGLAAFALGGMFLAAAFGFRRQPDRRQARRVVISSVAYLPLVLAALVLDVACSDAPSHDARHGAHEEQASPACDACDLPAGDEAPTVASDVDQPGAVAEQGVDGDVDAALGDQAASDSPRVTSMAELLGEDAPAPIEDGTGLPNFGELPSFELVGDDGRPFGRKDLNGDVWVVDFIFTSCSGTCPVMSQKYVELATDDMPARFLSVTVDPRRDSPEVLSAYREKHGGQADRWRLLTGSHEAIQALGDEGFRMPVNAGIEPVAGMAPLFHSGRFALVDTAGRIRGYYDYRDALDMQRLVEHARQLADVVGS